MSEEIRPPVDSDGRGECEECGRRIKINTRGVLATHGPVKPCDGSGMLPVRYTFGGHRVTR